MFWLGAIIGLFVGFVVGVLFGRSNHKKVERAIDYAKEEYKDRIG